MPVEMTVELRRGIVITEPFQEKRDPFSGLAELDTGVRACMSRVGVARIERERALHDLTTPAGIAGLDVRPAEIAQEPPILTPMRRQAPNERPLCLCVVRPAAEGQE